MEPEAHVGVGFRCQRNPAGAGHREPRRRHIQIAAQFLASDGKCAGDLTDGLTAHGQIRDPESDVVPRHVERAAAGRGELRDARERGIRVIEGGDLLDRNPPGIGVERIRRVPADERGAGHRPAALGDVDGVEANPGTIESQRRGGLFKGLAVRHPLLDRHAAEPNRTLIRAREVKLAAQQPVDRIVVDLKGMAQARHIAPHEAKPRVDLLAAIVARVAEGEEAVGMNLRPVAPHVSAADGDVAVVDRHPARRAAPGRVPGAEIVAAERPLDPRRSERPAHLAVELAPAAERDRPRPRSEIVHDPDEHLIAFLPVGARRVKFDRRAIAPHRRALERFSGAAGLNQLSYRWPNVQRIVSDIHAGLAQKDERGGPRVA